MSRNPPIPGATALQRRYNLKAWLAARHMKPESYGTWDVSLEWPLPLEMDFDDIVGGTAFTLANPLPGTHSMVLRTMFVNVSGVDPTESIELRQNTPGNRQQIIALMQNIQPDIPLIGTVSCATQPAGNMLMGVRPVYVPEGFKLEVAYGAPALSSGRVYWTKLTYPSSQPLTTLFNYA